MLDPTSFAWMNRLDTFAHWLGWELFRQAPVLQLPLGASEAYGLERSTSIVFSDSIPLVALGLHPFSAILPAPFQYLGLWTLLCFILQAYFGYRLMRRLFVEDPRAAIAATLLLVMAPPMLNRLHIHTSLLSHWLLLAGLLFYLESDRWRWRRWALLLVAAVLIHGYLFAMVAALWGAHLVKIAVARRRSAAGLGAAELARAAAAALAVMVGCGAVMYLAGYFGPPGPQLHLYGEARYDLAGPLCTRELWSQVVPSLGCQSRVNDWDGLAFLGVGVLGALVVTLVMLGYRLLRRPAPAAPAASVSSVSSMPAVPGASLPRWPLLVTCGALLAFAATNEVALAGRELFSVPLPNRALALAETFRSSGRFLWPAFYLALYAILAGFARIVPARHHLLLLLPLGLGQLLDVRPGLDARFADEAQSPRAHELRDPAWRALAHYDRLISVPAAAGQTGFASLMWQAAKHGVATNLGLSNRTDKARADAGQLAWLRTVTDGRLDPRAVYLFPGQELWEAARAAKGAEDVALVADGNFLLFPGGRRHGLVDASAPPRPPLPFGVWRAVGEGADGDRYLSSGWSWSEAWGRWNSGPLAGLTIRQRGGDVGRDRRIVLDVIGNEPAIDQVQGRQAQGRQAQGRQAQGKQAQRYRALVWGQPFAEGELAIGEQLLTLDVPGALNAREWLFVELQLPDAKLEPDGRELALGVRRLWISEAPGTSPSLLTAEQQRMIDAPAEAAQLPVGQWRSVGDEQAGEGYLLGGWSWPEAWGRWSVGDRASVALPQAGELGVARRVQLDVTTHTTAEAPRQRYRARVAGQLVGEGQVGPGEAVIELRVPAALTASRTIVVELELPDAAASGDGRRLAVGLRRVALQLEP